MFTDSEIARIGEGVIARTLPKAEWTHAAHFAAAVWVLTRPHLDGFRDMPDLIRAYNEATGVTNTDTAGYHETITQASLRAAHAQLAARPQATLSAVLGELLAGPLGRSDWLLTYWSRERLFSIEARRAWVEPNLRRCPSEETRRASRVRPCAQQAQQAQQAQLGAGPAPAALRRMRRIPRLAKRGA